MTTTTKNTISQLVRQASYFNPMFLNGKEINHIVFYDANEGKTLLEPDNENVRWFNSGGSNNDYPLVQFPFEFKKANKIDLTRKDAFFTYYAYKYNFDKGKIVLYIPIHLLTDFKDLGEEERFQTDTEINYLHNYQFTTLAQKVEPVIINDEVEWKTSELKPFNIQFHGYYRIELKPLGKKIEEITEKVKTVYPGISKYTIEQIMEVCDITIK